MVKKDSPEEDWFEDDDAEEKQPKKKKGGKKKKNTKKVVAWIVAFIVILAILLFIRFKYAAPEAEEAPFEELPPPEEVEEVYLPEPEESDESDANYVESDTYHAPKEAPGPAVVPKEDLPKVEEVIDTSVEPELFSNLNCDYDYDAKLLYMSLRIYNILDEDIKISPRGVMKGYNTYFLIRGVVDTDPGCGTELVQPGEWTECKRIGFDLERYATMPGINRISVQVPGRTEALLVECPAYPESHFETEE
ncbi:hypothetical protein JW898_04900 [Candidatus Woesearchaeota archaeon]|nr:hypothetical protein [Candidatus Woesearchaeota archaeon]